MTYYKNNRAVSEILLMTGLTTFLGLLNFFVAPIPFIAALLTPLPSVWLVVKYGLNTGLFSLLAAVVLMVIPGASLASVLLIIIQFGFLGIVIGLLFKNHVTGKQTLAATFVAATVLSLAGLAIAFISTGGGSLLAEGDVQGVFEQFIEFYQETGVIQDANSAQAMAMLEDMARVSALLFPGSIVLWSLGSAFLTLLIARVVLGRLQYETEPLPSFSEWSLPWVAIWGLILGLSLALLGDEMSWFYVAMAGKNLLFVFGFVFLLLGASFTVFFVRARNFSRLMKVVLAVFAVFYFPIALIVFLILGVLDTLLNLRGKIGKKGVRS